MTAQYMDVDQSRADAFVPKEFVDSSDIVARLREMGGKGMPEGMTADVFDHFGLAHGFLHCPLKNRLVSMMRICFSGEKLSRLKCLCAYRHAFAPSGKGELWADQPTLLKRAN
jgi:hypothetical protein